MLPGGLGRFVPCSIGANHCRLRHIGWEKCGHGLTSRPRESASELCYLEGSWSVCTLLYWHCRLRHVGWERCSHGLTSRPVRCLLVLFPSGIVLQSLELLFGLCLFLAMSLG